MTAQELGNLPADEMTIRQRMLRDLAIAMVASPLYRTPDSIVANSAYIADGLLHEMARVR